MPTPRILVVDSGAQVRSNIREILKPLEANISEARNAEEALTLARLNNFGMVLTDINLAGMDGVELCTRLKHDPVTQSLPIIIVTSLESDTVINRSFDAGARAVVTKREMQKTLLKAVEDCLQKSSFRRNQMILVVDDSRTMQRIVQKGLVRAGFNVCTAGDGQEGLQYLKELTPNLIISDIDMPVMNGFAFCEAVHANEKLAGIPFVVMSANRDRSHMKRMVHHGAQAYLVKPFNIEELIILVEKLLSDQYLNLLNEKKRMDREQSLIFESIAGLISALEARDAYTRGHSEAVAKIVSGMVKMSGGSIKEVESATIGGKLHDIGKIGIRDSVLLKPGALTEEEFAIIKQHPQIGANILKKIPSLKDILPIVLTHHERIDGKGYPQGLKGDEIPLWGRITAVADTYHALVSDRPYRKGMPVERALEIIDKNQGTQLCVDCVDLFKKWLAISNVNFAGAVDIPADSEIITIP